MKKKEELKAPERPLWLTGTGYTIVVSKDAEGLKKSLLHNSSQTLQVTNVDEAELAKHQRDEINKVLIDVEKTRALVKKPVLDKGKEIDQVASTFTMDLTSEKLRLDKLIGNFTLEQEKIRREAADRAMREAAERERLQREAEEAEAKAERMRLGAEQAAAEAENRRERQAAELAAKAAEAEQARAYDLSHASGVAGMAAHEASMVVMDNAKVRGTSVVVDFEVESLTRLYAAMPHLVELTARRRDILNFLAQQKASGVPVGLPGLKIVERVSVR